MPAIAIVAGVAGIASGVSAIAAGAGIIGTLAAGAAIAGGAMSVVGAATGNKKLTKVGGLVGLGGGVVGGLNGTLGDPTKVLSGGGFIGNTTQTSAGVANSASGVLDSAAAPAQGSTSMLDKGVDAIGNFAAGTAKPATDAVGAPLASATTAINSPAATQGSTFASTMDKIAKYDKLVNVAGGMAEAYMKNKETQAAKDVSMAQLNQNQQIVNMKLDAANATPTVGIDSAGYQNAHNVPYNPLAQRRTV